MPVHQTALGPVVITGGASGIGLASARLLAEVGRSVALWDLAGDAAESAATTIAAEFGVAAFGAHVDVTKQAELATAMERSRAAVGPVVGVVHAAGMVSADSIGTLTEDNWDRVLDVNLRSFAMVLQAASADLATQRGAAAVGISSIEGLIGHWAIPAYCASKAGLIGLVRSLASAMNPVRVNAVCPGYIDTPMLAPALQAPGQREHMESTSILGRLGQPEDIAGAVRFLLSADASFITGTHLVVDGGTTAIR